MSSDYLQQEAVAVAALRRLGRLPWAGSLSVRLLAGGLSGSAVYRLALDGEDAVLKVTPPGGDRLLMERSRREALFYRELAARLPIAVPRVLGLEVDEAKGAVLLLAAYAPTPPPEHWTERDFVEVAREVGRLHAAFWEKSAELAVHGWLRSKPPVTPVQCGKAAGLWRAVGERDDLRDAVTPYRGRLEGLLESIPALDARMTDLPVTLCHGDCHTGNLLRGPAGAWIWVDWQEVRLGPGVDDLSFCWQRAFAATDTPPPYRAMVDSYAAGLERAAGVTIAPEQLDRALAWTELRSWLVDWPGYLGFLPATRVERVLHRIEELIDEVEVAGLG